MSDIVARTHNDRNGTVTNLQLTIPVDRLDEFKTILNRALNTWAQSHSDWVELADILNNGMNLHTYEVVKHNLKNKHGV